VFTPRKRILRVPSNPFPRLIAGKAKSDEAGGIAKAPKKRKVGGQKSEEGETAAKKEEALQPLDLKNESF
jgi:hypothetical protein